MRIDAGLGLGLGLRLGYVPALWTVIQRSRVHAHRRGRPGLYPPARPVSGFSVDQRPRHYGMDIAENQPRARRDAPEHTWREE
jgi:hypothetical protein